MAERYRTIERFGKYPDLAEPGTEPELDMYVKMAIV